MLCLFCLREDSTGRRSGTTPSSSYLDASDRSLRLLFSRATTAALDRRRRRRLITVTWVQSATAEQSRVPVQGPCVELEQYSNSNESGLGGFHEGKTELVAGLSESSK